MKITFKHECPVCTSDQLETLKREWWMSCLPFSTYRRCKYCFRRFLSFFD